MADGFTREHLRKLGVVPIEDHRTWLSKAERGTLRHDAARVQFSRELRRRVFGSEMFGEPGWDILLALYVGNERESSRMDAQELAKLISCPISTTLRWMAHLEEEGLVLGVDEDKGDRPPAAELTSKGSTLLDRYLMELRQSDVFGPLADNGQ